MNGLEERSVKSKLVATALFTMFVAAVALGSHQLVWWRLALSAGYYLGSMFALDLANGILDKVYPLVSKPGKALLFFLLFCLAFLSWIGYGLMRYWVASGGLQRLENKLQARKTRT